VQGIGLPAKRMELLSDHKSEFTDNKNTGLWKRKKKVFVTGRRDALKTIGLGSAAMLSEALKIFLIQKAQQKEKISKPPAGLPPIKIKSVKAIGVSSSPEGAAETLLW